MTVFSIIIIENTVILATIYITIHTSVENILACVYGGGDKLISIPPLGVAVVAVRGHDACVLAIAMCIHIHRYISL